MLRKLLKYEFKATGRGIIPLYGALLFLALLSKIFVINKINVDDSRIIYIMQMLSILLYGATMAAIAVATILIIVQRFHKNLLSDEGYLMNTIPVSINANITSKLIVSTVWCCISMIIAVISILILAATKDNMSQFFSELSHIFGDLFNEFGINVPIVGLEFFLAGIAQIALNIVLLYASVCIGHLLPKMKILGAFAAYLGLNTAMTIIITSIAQFSSSIVYFRTFIENFAKNSPVAFTHAIAIGALILNIIWFIIFYVITHYILKNKLNLE